MQKLNVKERLRAFFAKILEGVRWCIMIDSLLFYFKITDDLLIKNHPFQIQKKMIEKGEKQKRSRG